MVGSGPNPTKSIGSQRQDYFRDLEQWRHREGSVHTTHTSGSHSQKGTTFLLRKIPKSCSWRLITWKGAYATSNEGELLLSLTFLLIAKRMVAIGTDQGLLLVSLFRMMKTTIMSAETKIHLQEVWEMMLWVKHLTKFLDHLSHARLREGDFLGSSLSPRSPCTMVVQTLWSM